MKNENTRALKITDKKFANPDLWHAIHVTAQAGHSLSLLPDQVRSLSQFGKASTMLAVASMAKKQPVNSTAAVQEVIHWHNVDLHRPDTERSVNIRDAQGHLCQGFYNQMIDAWQSHFPSALTDYVTHWSELAKGPDAQPPLNTAPTHGQN